MITISHLCKKYGNHYAVKDLNLTLEKGKIYGFLGPNGAGKTTTCLLYTSAEGPAVFRLAIRRGVPQGEILLEKEEEAYEQSI